MKKYLLPSLRLTLVLLVLLCVIYPLFIMLVGKLAPGGLASLPSFWQEAPRAGFRRLSAISALLSGVIQYSVVFHCASPSRSSSGWSSGDPMKPAQKPPGNVPRKRLCGIGLL